MIFTIKSVNGVEWNVMIVNSGDMDSHDCLNDGAPLVEFFDGVNFVASYYVSTILECEAEKCGLNLDGGVPEWSIDASSMLKIITWLKENA